MPSETESNPFEAPLPNFEAAPAASTAADFPRTVKVFNEQILALGALWIILGFLGTAIFSSDLYREWKLTGRIEVSRGVALGASCVVCAVWFVMGVLACRKVVWAVRVGLVFTYILMLIQLLSFALLGALLAFLAIQQGRRVLEWAEKMKLEEAA